MSGTVYLVGSGPGDPELLTVKAKRLLEAADVVLHDKLPGPEILESIPAEKREDVGKRAGGGAHTAERKRLLKAVRLCCHPRHAHHRVPRQVMEARHALSHG